MSVAALLLSDSRFPAGGHAHSGGVEPAVTAGTVSDLASLEAFLRGRLRTAGLVAAGLAAAACAHRRCRTWRTCARMPSDAAPATATCRRASAARRCGRDAGRMGGINGPFDMTVLIFGICLTPRPTRGRRRRRSGRRRGGRGGRCCGRPGWRGRRATGWPASAAAVAAVAGGGASAGSRPRGGAASGATLRREYRAARRAPLCSGRLPPRQGARRLRQRGSPRTRRWPGPPARLSGCLPLIRCGPPGFLPGSPGILTRSRSRGPQWRGRAALRPALRVRTRP